MPRRLPPGPRDFLGIRSFRTIKRDFLGFCVEVEREFGDAATFCCGPLRFFQFTHPDQIADVLARKSRAFEKPRRFKRILGKWNGQGLVTSEGELWKRQRRLVQGAFHPRRVRSYGAAMVQAAERMVADWNPAQPVEIVDATERVTLDIVARTLFGLERLPRGEDVARAVAVLQVAALREFSTPVSLPDWLPTPHKRRLRWAIEALDDLIWTVIRERRASGEDRGDLLSMLLLAVDADGDGQAMSDRQVRDEAMTLLLAGHETTATAIAWTLYLLAANRAVQEQVAASIHDVVGDRSVGVDDLEKIPLLEMVVKETMRVYPPVYFTSRQAIDHVEIGGYDVRPGDQVHLVPYVTHHDPRWFAEPDQFRPERFSSEKESALPQFAYFPFGGGPRACIGRGMAMLEASLVVSSVLRRFLLIPAAAPPRALAEVSLHPEPPLWIHLERRPGAATGKTAES